MYIPAHFKIEDMSLAYEIIKTYSFATLFSMHNGLPFATHLPLWLDEENGYLYGHFARSNPQWHDIEHQQVLAVFHGPHCYISPSWYEEPTKAVPTWNYITVHVYGEVYLLEDGPELRHSLSEQVLKYEGSNSPYRLEEVDPEFLNQMNRGIQGFKLKMNRIEGKAKLSQNHPLQRQKLIIEQLEKIPEKNEQEIALLMKANLRK